VDFQFGQRDAPALRALQRRHAQAARQDRLDRGLVPVAVAVVGLVGQRPLRAVEAGFHLERRRVRAPPLQRKAAAHRRARPATWSQCGPSAPAPLRHQVFVRPSTANSGPDPASAVEAATVQRAGGGTASRFAFTLAQPAASASPSAASPSAAPDRLTRRGKRFSTPRKNGPKFLRST
jgi:hypothetical protein